MERSELEEQYGKVWSTKELQENFTVIGFGYGVCVVKDKETGEKGSLEFDHMPRFYYNYRKD